MSPFDAGAVLAIEASTRRIALGLARPGQPPLERTLDPDRAHASELAPAADRLLSECGLAPADLSALAVGVGPGSFTGLRVAAAFALGLERSVGTPLIAVSSFAARLLGTGRDSGHALILTNARGGRVFTALYEAGTPPRELLAPTSVKLSEFRAWLQHLSPSADLRIHAEPDTLALKVDGAPLEQCVRDRLPEAPLESLPLPDAGALLTCARGSAPLAVGALRPLYLSDFGA